jgi:hypothetical protein
MPQTFILDGHARRTLVGTTNLSVVGSIGLGVFNVSQYSRLAGMISIIGSATVRYQMGISSGNYAVSSSFTANSGGSVFDVLNYGRAVDCSQTAANSQVVGGILICGEPLR